MIIFIFILGLVVFSFFLFAFLVAEFIKAGAGSDKK